MPTHFLPPFFADMIDEKPQLSYIVNEHANTTSFVRAKMRELALKDGIRNFSSRHREQRLCQIL